MLKVLIADDEELIRRMIDKMIDWKEKDLVPAGTAGNGLEVLSLLDEVHPDIIITDIRMPGVDGLDLIRQALSRTETSGNSCLPEGTCFLLHIHAAVRTDIACYLQCI